MRHDVTHYASRPARCGRPAAHIVAVLTVEKIGQATRVRAGFPEGGTTPAYAAALPIAVVRAIAVIVVATAVGVAVIVVATTAVPVVAAIRGVAVAVPRIRIAVAVIRGARSGSGAECETSDHTSCNSAAAPTP